MVFAGAVPVVTGVLSAVAAVFSVDIGTVVVGGAASLAVVVMSSVVTAGTLSDDAGASFVADVIPLRPAAAALFVPVAVASVLSVAVVVGSINVLGKGIESFLQDGAFRQKVNLGKLPISLTFPKTLMLPFDTRYFSRRFVTMSS